MLRRFSEFYKPTDFNLKVKR